LSEPPITGQVREYTAADGARLKYRHYRPAGVPRAYIVGVHGIQSHSGWYEWSSSRLAAAGCDVRFLDRRGSGMNEDERGHADSAEVLVRDVLQMVTGLRQERSSGQPIILAGVSWAGKLLAAMPEESDQPPGVSPRSGEPDANAFRLMPVADVCDRSARFCDGVALLYPAIFTHFDPHIVQRGAIRTANSIGLGRRTVPIPLDDPALFTDDPHWQQFIRDDPLTLRRISLSFLAATLDLTSQAERFPDRNPPPTFVALAGRDRIVDLERTREWVARLPAESTRLVEYPAARHTLEFDACREQFVADLIEWIESLVASRGT
jgi:acylglycerol lipase